MTQAMLFWLVILGALVLMTIDLALGVRDAQVRRSKEKSKSSSPIEVMWR